MFARAGREQHVRSLWSQTREDAPAGPYEALCRNGRNLRWQFSRHARGGPPLVSLWAVGVDITEEREALVRARELERIVALGNLVSELTHELRNPINGALLQLTVADRALARQRDESTQRVADAVAQATARSGASRVFWTTSWCSRDRNRSTWNAPTSGRSRRARSSAAHREGEPPV